MGNLTAQWANTNYHNADTSGMSEEFHYHVHARANALRSV